MELNDLFYTPLRTTKYFDSGIVAQGYMFKKDNSEVGYCLDYQNGLFTVESKGDRIEYDRQSLEAVYECIGKVLEHG